MGSVMRVGGGMRISQESLLTTVVSDGLECLEMWVRQARSNVFFTWNYLFYQVAVEEGMLEKSKNYIKLQEKKS